MSRLDSAIRRLLAQRACLEAAAAAIADLAGPVLELGLGNGRTYDHLRVLFPDRDIFVFERRVAAHPDCVPDDRHLILGDIVDTLPDAMDRIGAPAALAHADIGSGVPDRDRSIVAAVVAGLPALMAAGGVVVSDQALAAAAFRPLALPDGTEPGRYHLYRVGR